jgi:hypothetical protein
MVVSRNGSALIYLKPPAEPRVARSSDLKSSGGSNVISEGAANGRRIGTFRRTFAAWQHRHTGAFSQSRRRGEFRQPDV